MTGLQEGIKPEYILDIIIKRRWYLIVPFCIFMIVGIYLAITLPRIYRASTLILVQPQSVPNNTMNTLLTEQSTRWLDVLTEQILSSTNLEKIITEFNLYSGPGYEGVYLEDKVKSLQKKISIDIIRDRRRDANAFSISFKGENPEKVMQIANGLAASFINESLKDREDKAVGTSAFLEDELSVMRVKLESVESALKDYRKKYMGELPEQLESNLRILESLREQLSDRQQSLRDTKSRLIFLQNQASSQRAQQAMNSVNNTAPDGTSDIGGIDSLRAQLEDLRIRYTERHPDVIRLKKLIAELESSAASRSGNDPLQTTPEGGSDVSNRTFSSENRVQVLELNNEIASIDAEIINLRSQIELYEIRIENTPKREQELLTLKRDYDNIQSTYNSLLARKLEAEIAVNLEKKQKGGQFRIIDSARLPKRPIEPNLQNLFMIILILSLGSGAGIIFTMDRLNTAYKRPNEIEAELKIPVIVAIPPFLPSNEKALRLMNRSLSVVFICLSLLLFVSFASLTLVGVEQTLDVIRKIV